MTEQSHRPAAAYWEEISPQRRVFDLAIQRTALATLRWASDHWLLVINSVSFVLLILPTLVAPALLAVGWNQLAQLIFWAYSSICHQMPERSFFVFGQQMAFCERNTAIFGAFFLFGMVYILLRRRLKSLPEWLVVAYSLPIAVDGFTQLFGWRESTWELRLVTGAFFGLASVWYVFPHLELLMRIVSRQLQEQLRALEAR